VLPTSLLTGSSSWHQRPPSLPPSEILTIYRRGLVLRAGLGLFLLWIEYHFPMLTWPHAWILGGLVLAEDGLAALWPRLWPHRIWGAARMTMSLDGLFGLACAWAFSQRVTTNAPALLILMAMEILAYHPTVRGVLGAGGYLLFTTSLLGILPGHVMTPLLPWRRVLFWEGTNLLGLGGLLTLLRISWHQSRTRSTPHRLTPREQEVYRLWQAGLSVAQIATQLHIAVSTVKTHVHHIHHKLSD